MTALIGAPVASTLDELLARSNLTGRQLLIYAGQQLHPGRVLYDAVYAVAWPALDPRRFALTWQQMVDACDALRTVVEEIDGIPQQRVVPPHSVQVECVDVRSSVDPERALDDWIEQRIRRPLVLSECVFDTALVRTTDLDYTWFLNIHHIVADAAAADILIHRVSEHYAGAPGTPIDLPPFAHYVAQRRTERESSSYQSAREYWRSVLETPCEAPQLYGVDAADTTAQERVVLTLDRSCSAAVAAEARSLATGEDGQHAAIASLFTAVLAMYLRRVGGGEHVAIGTTFHNRRTDVERLTIGLFMEVIPLSIDVEPGDSLAALMRKVSSSAPQGIQRSAYSVGNSSRARAYVALVNYMRPHLQPVGSLAVRRIHPGYGSHVISLSIEPRGDCYELWFDVSAALAGPFGADRIAGHFRTLLEAALREPQRAHAGLSLLPAPELESLVAACRGPTMERPATGGCHAPFEARAAATPDAVAIVMGGTRMSHAELNGRANRLARRLRALGAGRGRRVGICLERSPEMLVAVLAVLKSGAAYVPFDPGYPPTRLRTMLDDADVMALVTTAQLSATLPAYAARPLFIENEDVREARDDDPGVFVAAADVAYVIYTSGSTGRPKGVLVTHGGVSNHLAWRESHFPLTPADRVLQTASLSFDDSVWEILEPLRAGACVVLARPRFDYDSAYLVRLMIEQRITVACFVPSLLRAVIEEPEVASCRSLRRLTTGGEGLSVTLQQRVLEMLPATSLYNGYGTTETTIASTFWKCTADPRQSTVPIGRPIANTQVYVLDSERQVVPPGVLGEIYIGGAGVARGYLNRPELTAERFVDDPFANSSATLYRTGDLGRRRHDGVLEFAARMDDQVKIRGVRVELGEIETALLDHPGVRAAAVVVTETPAGTRVIAYVVPRRAEAIPAAELREFVRDRIPAAMIPNRFESIAALPLTPSGKLDRRSLPAVAATSDDEEGYVAPRYEMESQLVSLWQDVLEARPIGIRDDFFALGGHSLSAVRVAAAVERLVGRSVSPGILFEAPTIELLARRVSSVPLCNQDGPLVLLADGDGRAPLFLVHHVSGDITAYRDLARYVGGGRAIYGLRAPELDSNAKPLDRIEAMGSRYVQVMRRVQPQGPYLIGGHSAGALIAFEMARQLDSAGERMALLAILEADAGMGGRRGLLDAVRFGLDTIRRLPARQRGAYLWRKLSMWLERRRTPVSASHAPQAPHAGPAAAEKNAVWTAVEHAVRAYRPQPYPGALTLFRATDRSVTGTYGRTLGWGRLAMAGVRVVDVPGSHSTVLKPGSEPPMAARLRACLEEIAARQQ